MRLKIKLLTALVMAFGITASYAQDLPANPTDISPLLIGEKVPSISILDADSKKHNLKDVVSEKPTLLIFYRGGWCPYCNKHLADLQTIEQDILDMGYQIVAISPDSPEGLHATVDKNELKYDLYSDSDLAVTKAFGLAYKAPEKYKKMLFNASAEKNPGELPVPALFVVDQEGTIQFEYINPNYDQRINAPMLKAVLENL
ncbi:peroxiredoxin [Echinicola pacifica]|uniref:thioredoxin-dependent peroxiredoxin n=1 Tax=Echinicola pacifica TaxID=346377 RepID=A0A918UME2_9BACT|nr:peroxiredoxin-like family protein [Echinicola pacifica]GGZ20487.1 peroxiredoxin [Echinicola pacifica]